MIMMNDMISSCCVGVVGVVVGVFVVVGYCGVVVVGVVVLLLLLYDVCCRSCWCCC